MLKILVYLQILFDMNLNLIEQSIILGNIIGINDSTANENNVGRHEREPDSSREQKIVNVITRTKKERDENINNRDTQTHSQLEKSHDSVINLDSLGETRRRKKKLNCIY